MVERNRARRAQPLAALPQGPLHELACSASSQARCRRAWRRDIGLQTPAICPMSLQTHHLRCKMTAMLRHAVTVEDSPPYVSMAEAADLLQVSARTIRRRVADGSLPAYRMGDAPSSRVRLRVDELLAWVEGK